MDWYRDVPSGRDLEVVFADQMSGWTDEVGFDAFRTARSVRSRDGRSRKVMIAVLPVAWNCVGVVDGREVVDRVVSRSWIVTWD